MPSNTPLSGGRWITVNGEHRYIGSDGSVEAGRPFFKPDDEVRESVTPTNKNSSYAKQREKYDSTDVKSFNSRMFKDKKLEGYGTVRVPVSSKELTAVQNYVAGGYQKMNSVVQKEGVETLPKKGVELDLQNAIAKSPVTEEDQILYRHFAHDPQHQVGETVKHNGFVSTSQTSISDFMGGSSKFGYEIAVPKGSRGVLTGHNPQELEATLSHGSQFKVLGKKQLQYNMGDGTKQTRTIYQLAYLGPGESS